eukprot:scaffold516_cov270-Pinguiococcus_pyrenoidosus.AAC.14
MIGGCGSRANQKWPVVGVASPNPSGDPSWKPPPASARARHNTPGEPRGAQVLQRTGGARPQARTAGADPKPPASLTFHRNGLGLARSWSSNLNAKARASTAGAVTMRASAPKFEWIKVCSAREAPMVEGTKSVVAAGLDLCLVAASNRQVFCVSNKCPPLNQPTSQGKVVGMTIEEPLYGTRFNLKTGEVDGDWCPSFLGKAFGWLFAPQALATYDCRVSAGGNIEVRLDVNSKAQFEEDYWKGILDAKGKATGEYY